ncbi:HAMP domain-containing histidine kinase [Paenibacillus donghaensis]|uniref:sensor histidine kinase n=1 Tax=Paenibacillus donghaensis TaxID=414771 RepID=UPI001883E604|nr:HAMP domain-containing sensor histidine kinase [Paenibacillus donghaensis]MBE9917550.1 HAMP domain-containing histidine kinase [Paenibacillus donghaensis]
MRTIRGRIFTSLIIVMIFSVLTTVFLFNHLIDGMLMDQARNQLRLQMTKAIDIIEGGDLEDLSTEDLELRFRDRMFYADFFVVDASDKIVAAGEDDMVGGKIHVSMSPRDHFFTLDGQKMMYTHQRLNKGLRIIVYTPMDILKQISGRVLRVSLLSIVISFAVIFVVGLWFVWKTTRPLQQLKEAVSKFNPKHRFPGIPQGDTSEIGQLINTFSSMSERIQKQHQQQIEFLQNVSHELRTPLMSIQGYASAVKDQVVTVEHGLNVVTAESQRLIQMVDRLLQLTRMETLQEEWKLTEVDLQDMMEHVHQLIAPAAADRNIQSALNAASLEMAIPAEQIFQVAMNFMQNAVRYASHEIKLSLEEIPGGFRICVDDDGPGVPVQERDSVFDRYYTGQSGITGIGLAICKQIADRLGAGISCTESPLGGARFCFEYQPDGHYA